MFNNHIQRNISYILIIFISLFVILTSGCKNKNNVDKPVEERFVVYTVTDFHGAIEEDNNQYGIARLANYIKKGKEINKDHSVVISAGDMFQGTAISNYNRGRDVINMMNMIGFDAMTVGNHEFDWYLNTITSYRDQDLENGEANFPFLGANINQKSTNELPDGIEPYTIVERSGVKIGIIGYMAEDAESDIQAGQIEDYEFVAPVEIIKSYVKELRTTKDVDVIIVSGHDASTTINQSLANQTGDYRIDGIINGHSHQARYGNLHDSSDRLIPYVQAGKNGEYVGEIEFIINKENNTISSVSSRYEKMSADKEEDQEIVTYVNNLKSITDPLFSDVIGIANKKITHSQGVYWAATSIQTYAKCDIGIINTGGIRSSAFPIEELEEITISKVFEIMPFENCLKKVTLKGKDIYQIVQVSDLAISKNCSFNGSNLYINGELVDYEKSYTVATIDYVYDNSKYPFIRLDGTDVVSTNILFRDILIENITQTCIDGSKWNG